MDDDKVEQQLVYWLALLRMPSIGNSDLHRLIKDLGTPEAIFNAKHDVISRYGLRRKAIQYLHDPIWRYVESDTKWLQEPGNHLITFHSQYYPPLLKQIHDPPLALYVRGDPSVMSTLQISIVGSRHPTPYGRRIARDFASYLAELKATITSGLASGIDSYSHLGALDVGGKTIAVLGSGLKIIYPAVNKNLAARIVENGALVSEFPPDFRPIPANFPRRNRIISGLSLGTLVVEAALKSGSLISARHAMEQGREVFAIPGSIYNQVSRGCHELIRQGAKLVETIDDILDEIGSLAAVASKESQYMNEDIKNYDGLDNYCKFLLDNIGYQPIDIDSLVDVVSLPVNVVSTSLLHLELQGFIDSLPGGNYIRL